MKQLPPLKPGRLLMPFLAVSMAFSSFSCRIAQTPTGSAKPVTTTDSVWNASNIQAFEAELETLRKRYHIPGLSAGIVNEGNLAWKSGFGFTDVEHQKRPDEKTVYQIASVTKTFGSIILMQLVEAGKVNLDDPITKYGINLGARWNDDDRIKVKHLLTHTAMGNSFNGFKPGYTFRYNGDWYNRLGKVIEKASGETFGELLMKNIVVPLQMKNTAPSTDDSVDFSLTGYDEDAFMKNVAKPYDWKKHHLVQVHQVYTFGPAAGIMSCVENLAKYSMAIDDQKFLNPETWQKVFTPFVSPKGKTFQYGLGWFVKYYKGTKIVWHTGWWNGYSALLIKIPDKDLAFIILANSQDLSRPFYHIIRPIPGLGIGMFSPFSRNLNNDLMASAFARAFIDHFAPVLN